VEIKKSPWPESAGTLSGTRRWCRHLHVTDCPRRHSYYTMLPVSAQARPLGRGFSLCAALRQQELWLFLDIRSIRELPAWWQRTRLVWGRL